MNNLLIPKFNTLDRRVAYVLLQMVLVFIVLTMTQDFLRSDLKDTAYYFSESLIFSSFWWLFAPLLFLQYVVVNYNKSKRIGFQFAVISLPIFIHLLAFPLLVWMLSKMFYYHTYSIQQTLRYAISEYVYLLVLFYTIPVLVFQFFTNRTHPNETVSESQKECASIQYINTLIVSEGNKKHQIAVDEILYCSANPPYITLHLDGKKYLHTETLKSISFRLNPNQFVRIHKSTIVNIDRVVSYTTRLNGDYDLTLKNNVQLRLSRNYATDFKNQFNKTHQLTTK